MPIDVDLAIQLVFQGAGKASAGPGSAAQPEEKKPIPITFLRSPNPLQVGGAIAFGLKQTGSVSLQIYDISGRVVRTLADGTLAAGVYTRSWDGRDAQGKTVASGIYLVRLIAPDKTLTQKLLMTK